MTILPTLPGQPAIARKRSSLRFNGPPVNKHQHTRIAFEAVFFAIFFSRCLTEVLQRILYEKSTNNNMKNKSAFPEVKAIQFEGPKSKNPLAFKHYNADEIVEGKTMRDHLRFSVVYWHTFRGTGSDPFGMGTMQRPWDDGSNSVSNAQNRARVAIEFIEKLGAPFYCLSRP